MSILNFIAKFYDLTGQILPVSEKWIMASVYLPLSATTKSDVFRGCRSAGVCAPFRLKFVM